MNSTVKLAMIGVGLIALGACAREEQQAAAQQPTATAQVPIVSDVLQGSPGARSARPGVTAPPAQGCQAPQRGQHTMRVDQMARAGSLQIVYSGRDNTFRTQPFVFMFQTNATLINRDNSIRNNANFGLWQGQSQELRMCGQSFNVDLVRATNQQVTVALRPR